MGVDAENGLHVPKVCSVQAGDQGSWWYNRKA